MAVWMPLSFAAAKKRSRKIRLQETLASGEGQPSSGTAVIRQRLSCTSSMTSSTVTSRPTVFSFPLLNHDLDSSDLRFRITAPSAAKGTTLQENDGADARTVMDGIFLDIKDPSLDLSVIHHSYSSSSEALGRTVDDIILKRTGQGGKESAVACHTDYQVLYNSPDVPGHPDRVSRLTTLNCICMPF